MTSKLPVHPSRPIAAPRLPEVIYVETSNSCNSLCQTCPLTFFGNGAPRNLSPVELQSIVDQLPGLKRVVLHGIGEPLLNPHLGRMIGLLKERGIHTLFNSNIIALTQRRQVELIESGLDELRVSLDGATGETYRRARGVPALPKVVKHLREMVETRDRLGSATPRVSVWFTTMRENLHELASAVRIAADCGADEFYVQPLVYAGYGLAVSEQSIYGELRREEIVQIAEAEAICREFRMSFRASGDTVAIETLEGPGAQRTVVNAVERPWMACHRPWYLTYITAHGDVLPCCFIPFVSASAHPVHVLGNVFDQPIADIWNGPAYQDFRTRFLSSTPYDCCVGCGSRWSV